MHAKIKNGQVIEYPIVNLRQQLQGVSLPADLTNDVLLPDGYVYVNPQPLPVYDAHTQTVDSGTPVLRDGKWYIGYVVRSLDATELQQKADEFKEQIIQSAQTRLDEFARTRGYDGILSACTYASSTVPKFQAEGQYCVDARDNTWATLYTILSEVESGIRPSPIAYSDLEPELPVLTWPAT